MGVFVSSASNISLPVWPLRNLIKISDKGRIYAMQTARVTLIFYYDLQYKEFFVNM